MLQRLLLWGLLFCEQEGKLAKADETQGTLMKVNFPTLSATFIYFQQLSFACPQVTSHQDLKIHLLSATFNGTNLDESR